MLKYDMPVSRFLNRDIEKPKVLQIELVIKKNQDGVLFEFPSEVRELLQDVWWSDGECYGTWEDANRKLSFKYHDLEVQDGK